MDYLKRLFAEKNAKKKAFETSLTLITASAATNETELIMGSVKKKKKRSRLWTACCKTAAARDRERETSGKFRGEERAVLFRENRIRRPEVFSQIFSVNNGSRLLREMPSCALASQELNYQTPGTDRDKILFAFLCLSFLFYIFNDN